jgi:hypothetical protein
MFSKHYRAFADWLGAQTKDTAYVRKIKRLHALHPRAVLGQLRRHPSSGTMALGRLKRTPSALVSPRLMTLKEQRLQRAAIDVAKEMRKTGHALTVVTKRLGVNRPAVSRRLAPYLTKRGGRLVLAQSDRLPRPMRLYDAHGAYTVVVRSRADASKIGRYHAALKRWRRSFPRNPKILAPFARIEIHLQGVSDEGGSISFDKAGNMIMPSFQASSPEILAPPYTGTPTTYQLQGTSWQCDLNPKETELACSNVGPNTADIYAYPSITYEYSVAPSGGSQFNTVSGAAFVPNH